MESWSHSLESVLKCGFTSLGTLSFCIADHVGQKLRTALVLGRILADVVNQPRVADDEWIEVCIALQQESEERIVLVDVLTAEGPFYFDVHCFCVKVGFGR
jgi:hypothetical protein